MTATTQIIAPDGSIGTISWAVIEPPTPPPVVVPPTPTGEVPSDLLDLTKWKLTLPINKAQEQDNLIGYQLNPYFRVSDDQTGVLFQAAVNASTTSGSDYPRSELREDTDENGTGASWGSTDGKTHTLTETLAVTHLPVVKPQVVCGQVHDGSDDEIEILADGTGMPAGTFALRFRWNGSSDKTPLLIPSVKLGEKFTVKIVVANGIYSVSANGGTPAIQSQNKSGLYFKAGCYTQSNLTTEKDKKSTAYGEVIYYALNVTHV